MQQRAACGNDQTLLAYYSLHLVDDVKRVAQVILPDVAAVHHTQAQRCFLGQQPYHILPALGSTHQVYMQDTGLEFNCEGGIICKSVKVGGQNDLQFGTLVNGDKSLAVCIPDIIGYIGIEERLVNLYIFGTQFLKLTEYLYVNRQQSVQKFQTVKAGLFLLTQKQIGHGADEDRFCPDTKLQCLLEFGGSLVEREFKALVAGKLRNDIMVVGIEPFGHLHCRHIYSVLLITVSHCEIEFQTVILKRVITLRDGSQSQAQVKSLVIKREIVGGNEVDSGLLLQQPVLLTYQSCRIQQFLL